MDTLLTTLQLQRDKFAEYAALFKDDAVLSDVAVAFVDNTHRMIQHAIQFKADGIFALIEDDARDFVEQNTGALWSFEVDAQDARRSLRRSVSRVVQAWHG